MDVQVYLMKKENRVGLVFYLLKIRHQNPKKNDVRCGHNSSTVKLSQAINDFQQQQTGRLLYNWCVKKGN